MKDINWWKWGSIAVIAALIFLFGRSCGINSVVVTSHVDTLLKKRKDSVSYVPVHTTDTVVRLKRIHDTLFIDAPYPVYIPDNTPKLLVDNLADYERNKYYDTSIFGVRIKDTVRHNRIIGREIVNNKTDTTIRETKTIEPPKKLIWYWSVSGNRLGVGSGLGLKTTNDWVYNVEYNTQRAITGRMLIPIRLKHKK